MAYSGYKAQTTLGADIGASVFDAIKRIEIALIAAETKARQAAKPDMVIPHDTGPALQSIHNLQFIRKDIVEPWKLQGTTFNQATSQAILNKWIDKGNMLLRSINEIGQISEESGLKYIVAQTIESTKKEVAKRSFKLWPYILGGSAVYLAIRLTFNPRR
jgi:hypothetical protein